MRKKTVGFSLIEIILALGIFAFAAVTILTLLHRGLQTSREVNLESSAAILAGKINSLLKSSYAWTPEYINNSNLQQILGTRNLSQIAAGAPQTTTTRYTRALVNQDDEEYNPSEELEIEVATEISPLNDSGAAGSLVGNTALNQAIERIRDFGKNAVFVRIRISYPANAPENLRSTREFVSIITKTTDE
jgi:type II secretory pathway pseudopilin PulG